MADTIRIDDDNLMMDSIRLNLMALFKESLKENRRWLVSYFSCVFLGYIGLHYLLMKRIGKFILCLITFGVFGLMVLRDSIDILRNKFYDSKNEAVKTTYPRIVRLLMFFIYLAVVEMILMLIISRFGVKVPDLTTMTVSGAVDKVLDFLMNFIRPQ